jgi:hypothetical protein
MSRGAALVAPASKQLALVSARVFNRSGGSLDVGLMRKFNDSGHKLFTYDASNYTEVTLPLAAASGVIADTASNGFVLQTKEKSGLIGLNVSQADGGVAAYTLEYYNGSAFTALTTIKVQDFASTGEQILVFLPPRDWDVGGHADLDSAMYSIRVTTDGAGSAAVEADEVWSGQLLEFFEAVSDNNGITVGFDSERPMVLQGNEGVMPYFSTANAGNGIRVAYQIID